MTPEQKAAELYPAPTKEEVLKNPKLLPSDRDSQLALQEAFEAGANWQASQSPTPEAVAVDWNLDMGTVPKDGTDVMLWHKLWKCPIACRWLKGEWVTCTLSQTWPEEAFTAWMLMKPFTLFTASPEYKELFK